MVRNTHLYKRWGNGKNDTYESYDVNPYTSWFFIPPINATKFPWLIIAPFGGPVVPLV